MGKKKFHIVFYAVAFPLFFFVIYLAIRHDRLSKEEYIKGMNINTAKQMENEQHAVKNDIQARMGDYKMQAAIDMENKYKIVASTKDKKEMLLYAGKVATAYLDADDEWSYKKWKEIEKGLAKDQE